MNDLSQRLREQRPSDLSPLDVDRLYARAMTNRRRKRLAAASAAIVLVAGAAVGAARLAGGGGDESPQSADAAAQADSPEIEVQSVPTPDGSEGRCIEATDNDESATACIRSPGVFVWHVHDTDLVVSSGSVVVDGQQVPPDDSGFVVVPFEVYLPGAEALYQQCLTAALVGAVATDLGPEAPPFTAASCSPSYTFVNVEYLETAHAREALVYELRGNQWSFLAEVDFQNPDREARCAVLPDSPATSGGPTARELCSVLG